MKYNIKSSFASVIIINLFGIDKIVSIKKLFSKVADWANPLNLFIEVIFIDTSLSETFLK